MHMIEKESNTATIALSLGLDEAEPHSDHKTTSDRLPEDKSMGMFLHLTKINLKDSHVTNKNKKLIGMIIL
jgi:hypothetical protein